MNILNQVCTKQQSAKLKELGVHQESFFAYIDEGELLSRHSPNLNLMAVATDFTAAFTVAEMGEMLPATIHFDHWKCSLQCVRSGPNQEYFMCEYVTINYSGGTGVKTQVAHDTEAKARAAMLIHLIESNTVQVEDINKRLK